MGSKHEEETLPRRKRRGQSMVKNMFAGLRIHGHVLRLLACYSTQTWGISIIIAMANNTKSTQPPHAPIKEIPITPAPKALTPQR